MSGRQELPYGQLNARANQLAHLLVEASLDEEDLVGIYLRRGIDHIAAMIGVVKAGGAWTSLDPSIPADRLRRMVETGGVGLVLTDAAGAARLRSIEAPVDLVDVRDPRLTELPANDPAPRALPENLAYVVFTSGTTGVPKPVAVTQRSLANHAQAVGECYRLTPRDRVLQFAHVGFDVLIEEVVPTLLAGASVVVAPEPAMTVVELEQLLETRRVTVANLPASFWTHWVGELEARRRSPPNDLRLMVVGSEAAATSVLARWQRLTDVPVINAYGLSETTITVTTQEFGPGDLPSTDSLPIGHPIAGVETYVLDDVGRLVAPGETGELHIGGDALARGYPGRPGLTAERFVPNPFASQPGARLYRTGDLARQIPHGSLHLQGRTDDQVKIRGHRVEPSEVGAVLTAHPAVAAAVVYACRDGDRNEPYLVAYVVPRDDRHVPHPAELRTHLRSRLLDAMLPQEYVVLDALPLGANGKVDRSALPPVVRGRRSNATRYVAPTTETERKLADIWSEAVGIDQIGIDDDLFAIGGHSLTALRVAAMVRSTFGVDMPMQDIFAHLTMTGMACWLESAVASGQKHPEMTAPVRAPAGARDKAPLSLQQEQIWFLSRFAPESIAYHAQTTIRVVGVLDIARLDEAITEIERRHEILRTSYQEVDGQPWQVIHSPQPTRARQVDLRRAADPQTELAGIVDRELRRPFDILRLPLLRWTVVRISDDEHEIILVEHHLLHDGWSFALLMSELKALYNAPRNDGEPPVPELDFQYQDYARWQHSSLDAPFMRAHLDYWRRQLSDLPDPLELPIDRPWPPVQGFRGETLRVELPPDLPGAIRSFCRQQRVTLFTTMLTAFLALLHRYSGQEDICVASGFASRQVPGTEHLLGMFVNTVVLRGDLSGNPTFRTLVGRMRDVVLEATAHEDLPFSELVRALNPRRDAGRNPITQVMFSANDAPLPRLDLDGATGTIFEHGNGSAKVDLDVVVVPRAESQERGADHTDDRITLLWEYAIELFDHATMRRMVDCYVRLLADAVARPDTPVWDLALLGASDREQALAAASPDVPEVDSVEPLVHLAIAERAERTPDALAVHDGDRRLTYAELVGRAGGLAGHLRERGMGPEDVVAVCLPRGADLVVAELGVLTSGAAYLPLDPGSPPRRLAVQLADANACLVITAAELVGRLPEHTELVLLHDQAAPTNRVGARQPDVLPSNLAYVMSTSGTTGEPKTVMIDHGALTNFVSWRRRACDLTQTDRVTLISNPAFDGSVADIWPALAAGASVHIPDQDTKLDPERLQAWLLDECITVTDLPTALVERLLALNWPASTPFRTLISAGDRLRSRPDRSLPFRVVNEYGPTEATVSATAGVVDPQGDQPGPPDIGCPISGLSAYVLDTHLQPVPPGVSGELYLGGVGVARGYLNRPGLTAERFLPDPFSVRPGNRLYRTGDLARQLPGGRIAFLGRSDAQIKLRGYRIEPAEIAAVLQAHPAVGEAAVVARADSPGGERRLIAYVVWRDGGTVAEISQVREHLANRLPRYMVPSGFVVLPRLPLTRTGKLDEKNLPDPEPQAQAGGFRSPTTQLEKTLAGIWCQTLGLDRVGLDDNFFDIGGHSLLVTQVQRRLADLGYDLPIVAFFEHPTVNSLAHHLGDGEGQDGSADETLRAARRQAGRGRLQQRRERVGGGGPARTSGEGA